MGIFSKGTLTENNDNYELPEVGEYNDGSIALIVSEAYEGMYAIIESLYGIDNEEIKLTKDLMKLEESETDSTFIDERISQYELVIESAFKDTLDRMVNWIKAQYAKFLKFIAFLVRIFYDWVATGKAFATKYEEQLKALDLTGYTHPMYEYKNIDKGTTPSNVFDKVRSELHKLDVDASTLKELSAEDAKNKTETLRTKKEDIISAIRSDLVGNGDKSKYVENLHNHFRSEKKEPVSINIGEVINELKSEEVVKQAKNAEKSCKEYFNPIVANLEKAKKTVSSGSEEQFKGDAHKDTRTNVVSVYQAYISLIMESNSTLLQYIGAWEKAAKERQREFTIICKGAFSFAKKKKEPKKEEPKK